MNNSLKISVIIPVYNGESFLKENFHSLQLQSFSHFEVIYINDGSSDASEDILKQECARDSRFKWFSKPNGGIPSAIEFGIEQASSNYIVLLDQDDIATPNRLELTARAFKKGAELIMGDYEIVNEQLQSTGKVITLPSFVDSKSILLEQLKRSYILGSALAFKNNHDFSFLQNSGGATDYDISLKMLLKGYRFEYIPEVLIKYRVHQKNTSANYQNQKKDITNVLNQYSPSQLEETLRLRGFNEADIFLTLGIMYLFQDKIQMAESFLLKAEDLLFDKMDGEYEELIFYLGVLNYKLSDYSSSLTIFERLNKKSNNPSVKNNYGFLNMYCGNYNYAEELFKQCLIFNPEYNDAKQNLKMCQEGILDFSQYRFTERLLRKTLTHNIIHV